jgi:DDE superfamily endonuclease
LGPYVGFSEGKEGWEVFEGKSAIARRLVFVDEMGANTSLTPLYAWARRGKRARTKVPRNRGSNTTLLASMTHEGMGPCVAVAGSTTGEVPTQKWMNFYTKVLTKFAANSDLKLTLKVEVAPEGGVSDQRIEETKLALRELGLADDVEITHS